MDSLSRTQIVQLVRQWATSTTDALLDPACQFFTLPDVKGLIGYRRFYKSVVVYGDPVCAPDDIPKLTFAFHQFCEQQNVNIVYLLVSHSFVQWAMQNGCHAYFNYGDLLHLDAQIDPRTLQGNHASLVRRKLRRAPKDGVYVKEYTQQDSMIEQEMQDLAQRWLKHRDGIQIHISNVFLFDDQEGKRWFFAKRDEQMVGVVVLNRLESHRGWLLNHLMVTPEAPPGTPELLVVSALDALRNEGCSYASFGAVPTRTLSEIYGFGPVTRWTVERIIYPFAYRLFRLGGLKMFWGKFEPQTTPSYLLFSSPSIRIWDILAIIKAMNVSF